MAVPVVPAAFEAFFREQFGERLKAVGQDGMKCAAGLRFSGSSWDRKAAWLLWVAEGGSAETGPPDDPAEGSAEDEINDMFS